jgi:hypothetical protein
MQSGPAIHPDSPGELRRYDALLEMADQMVRHRSLPELFHEMAGRLRKVADFQFLEFFCPRSAKGSNAPALVGRRINR